jgi:tight adherence protein C
LTVGTLYVATVLGLIAACGVFAAVWSLAPAPPTNADIVEGRLRIYEAGRSASLSEIELQQPFGQRVVRPVIQRLGRLLEQTMPDRARQAISLKLQLAGRPNGMSSGDFIAVRYVLTGFLCLLGIGVGVITQRPVLIALGAAVGAVVGLYMPMIWLRRRISRRKSDMRADLPDVIDVLVVCVEAGLTFDAALDRVVEKYDHALAEEFGQVLQESRLGRPRLEALYEMGQRTAVEELNNFIQAVIQSEQLGSGIVRLLRVQSDEIRQKRLLIAQERGAKASLKMLLPMIGCIFPTLWIILLGPAALLAYKAFRGG